MKILYMEFIVILVMLFWEIRLEHVMNYILCVIKADIIFVKHGKANKPESNTFRFLLFK